MKETKSVYRRGADYGVPMGVYMSVMSVCSLYNDRVPMLALVVLVMLVGWPVMICRYQRRYKAEESQAEYAALWMAGILMVIYGALITGLVTWAVLQWGRPGFIYEQMQAVVNTYNSMPSLQGSELTHVLQQMLDAGQVPSAIEMVMSMFWFVSFAGSVVSAITAVFAGGARHKGF